MALMNPLPLGSTMINYSLVASLITLLSFSHLLLLPPLALVLCEDATKFLTWNVTYSTMAIIGNRPKQVTNCVSAAICYIRVIT